MYLFYFRAYIPSKESKLFERGFRILEDYGRNMDTKVYYFHSHLRNYGSVYFKEKYSKRAASYDRYLKWRKDDLPAHILEEAKTYLNQNIKVNESISLKTPTSPIQESDEQEFQFDEDDDRYSIVFKIADITKNLDDRSFNNIILKALNNHYFFKKTFFAVKPSYFFEGLKYDMVFESIVVFDSTNIIHSSSPDYQSLNVHKLFNSIEHNHSTVLKELMVKNEEKYLLIIPHEFLGKKVFLAGFISPDVYKQRTRSINIELLFFLAGIIILLIFSFPLLKIILISKQERLHTSDANFATISLIFCIGLGVILIFGSVKQFIYSRDKNKHRLVEISNKIHANLQEDLTEVYNIYNEIVGKSERGVEGLGISSLLEKARQMPGYHVLPFNMERLTDTLNKTGARKYTPYVPINDIIFMDQKGISRKSITVNYHPNKYRNELDLSKRDYFRNVKDAQKSWLWYDKVPYYIQSIQAYGTGVGETAISFNYKTTFNRLYDTVNTDYLAFTSTLPSVYHQITPSDIQFAVINQSGETLFHSEKNRNLHENFFEEVENRKIKAFIQTNKEKTLPVQYHGSNKYARIKPIQNTPLYLITLLDRSRVQERNARIILYSIYLLAIYIFGLFLGTLIISLTRSKNLLLKQRLYTYHWLVFIKSKERGYKKLILIILILLLGQIAALQIYNNIQIVLVYQFLVISLSAFFSLRILDKGYSIILNKKNKLGESIILFLSVLFLARLIYFFVNLAITYGLGAVVNLLPILFVIAAFILSEYCKCSGFILMLSGLSKQYDEMFSYKVFMGIWLLVLSVLPASHLIKTVSIKEQIIWERFELYHLSEANKHLLNYFQVNRNDDIYSWFKRTQGDKLDAYSIKLATNNIIPNDTNSTRGNYYYELLPTQYIKLFNEDLNPFLYHKDALDKTRFLGNSIYTYLPKLNKTLIVENARDPGNKDVGGFNKFSVFALWIILGLAIFFLFQYLLNHLLYANIGMWVKPKAPGWFNCLSNENYKRIALISFNYRLYINETEKRYTVYEVNHNELDDIDRRKFILGNPNNKVFITGIEWYINDVEKHTEVLNKIEKILLNAKATIIVCSPFEFEFIESALFEYFVGEKMDSKQLNNYHSLIGKWENILQHFFKYVGHVYNEHDPQLKEFQNKGILGKIFSREFSIDPSIIESFKQNFFMKNGEPDDLKLTQKRKEELILGIQQFLEPKYYYIWNHCTPLEKMVLFDLADDGMLNIKNKYLINRLISKRLIILEPEPRIFSESFRNFILTSVREEEAKRLEKKLSKGGQWNNVRFFVITIILAIAIFVFVIQGKSIDRVLAIMTSFLALLPAILKIFDGGMNFKFGK